MGEKRQREEEEEEDQEQQEQPSNGFKEAAQEPQSIPSSMRSPGNGANGSYGNNTTVLPGTSTPGAGQNSDALYIGDLQWVCSPSSSLFVQTYLRRVLYIIIL